MIAVVPAAGRGTRLGALTATTPKALVPVAGRPVLAWVLRGLALAGASEIIVVVGHLGEQIEACVADLSPVPVAVVHQREARGTADALLAAAERVGPAPFMYGWGDTIADPAAHFDAAGNTVQLAHLRSLRWSWRGCLERAVTVERSGGPVDDHETYGYGADGRRSRKRATRLVVGGPSPVVETRDVTYLGDQERVQVRRNGALVLAIQKSESMESAACTTFAGKMA